MQNKQKRLTFCVLVCFTIALIAVILSYHFIYLSKSPFYALLQDVEDKKLDMEVCYFMNSQKNAEMLNNIYSFCTDKKEKNLYYHKIRYGQYNEALKNAKIPKKIPTQKTMLLENNKDMIGLDNGVAIFFIKDSKPIYEIKLGICPKINGKNYEYNEDFYATLESIVATQDPARAKRILTYKKSRIHNDKTSCLDFYIAQKEKYFLRDKRVQAIEKVYYDCLDFISTDKKECEARRERDMWVLENEFDEDKERKYFLGE